MSIARVLLSSFLLIISMSVEANSFKSWLEKHAEDFDPFPKKNVSIFDANFNLSKEIVRQRAECRYVNRLSSSQRVALMLYGRSAYHKVNAGLRLDHHTPLSDMISEALTRLRSQARITYRYTRVDLGQYHLGARVIFKGFTSTSSDPNWFENGRRFGDVFMVIHSLKAKDTSCFSFTSSENEWLIDQGTEFIVTERYVKDGIQVISLTEL